MQTWERSQKPQCSDYAVVEANYHDDSIWHFNCVKLYQLLTFGEVNLNALTSCLLYSLLLYRPYAPTQISTVNLSNQ